jgi:putative acetyltransferase
MTALLVRAESAADAPAIRELHEQAFGGPEEARLVDLLRGSPAYVPELSLVAERDGCVVGHVLFSRIAVDVDGHEVELLALAPVAVLPSFQRQGIGSRMIREGLARAAALGYRGVAVLGHPSYYPRFGFRPAREWNLKLPWDTPPEVQMAMPLHPGGLDGVHGDLIYPSAFAAV